MARTGFSIVIFLCLWSFPPTSSFSFTFGTTTLRNVRALPCYDRALPHAGGGRVLPSAGAVHCRASSQSRDDSTAELVALAYPMQPDPALESEQVIKALVGGLQHNDIPQIDTGLKRFYNFADFTCKSALTARQGARSLQNFTKYASREPVFSHIVRCESFELGETTLIRGTQTRGDIASHIVTIRQKVGFRYRSGLERASAAAPAAGGDGEGDTEEIKYRIMLMRERLPPLAGCWLVHECLCLKHGMLFNGDSGGTTTD